MSEERGSTDLIRYLLKELPEDQVEQIEQKYFSSDESFEEVEHAEAELIDLYVSGALEPQQREKFEQLYLNWPKRKQRIQFAEALHAKASETNLPGISVPSEKWPIATKLLAAAMVIFALAGAWLIREFVQLRTENTAARQEIERLKSSGNSQQQQSKIQKLEKELDQARIQEDTNQPAPVHGAKPQPTILAVVMSPGLARGAAGMKTLSIDRRTDFIRFELKLDRDPFNAYRISLQTAAGDELWSLGLLKPSNTAIGKTIVFDLPASRVEQRDYVLLLQGKSGTKFENVSAYPFRVRKAS